MSNLYCPALAILDRCPMTCFVTAATPIIIDSLIVELLYIDISLLKISRTCLASFKDPFTILVQILREVYFADVTNSAFSQFYFRGSQDFGIV